MWRRCRNACCCGRDRSLFHGNPCGEAPSPRPSPHKRGEGARTPGRTGNSRRLSGQTRSLLEREGCFMRGAKIAKTNTARRLRRNATIAEHRLWYRLCSRSLYELKFVRQEPIGPYIVDFVCREQRLIIDVDGGQHAESERDLVRDQWLRDREYRILRFWNNDVIQNTEGVLGTIASALQPHGLSAPSPRLRGEGRGEGASPQAESGGDTPSPVRREG